MVVDVDEGGGIVGWVCGCEWYDGGYYGLCWVECGVVYGEWGGDFGLECMWWWWWEWGGGDGWLCV